MTELNTASTPQTPASQKKLSRRILVGTMLVLVLIAGSAVVASKAGLDKALVRQQLDSIAVQMRDRGKIQGRDVTFTYGDIEVKGGFSNRYAEIRDPKIQIKPLEAEGFVAPEKPQSLIISSPVLEVHPEASNLSAMRLALPQPINFATIEAPDQSLLKITASEPLAVNYARDEKDDVPYTNWSFKAPAELKLTYLHEQEATGVEDQTPTITPVYETLVVTMEKGEGELSVQRDNAGLGQGMLEMKSIAITPEAAPEQGRVTIAQIISQWSNQRNERNLNVVNSSFSVDRIEAAPELLPYAPVSMALDVTYEGAMPSTPEEMAAIESDESAFKLKTFSLTTKDAKFNATADFVASSEDRLPVGIANVTITNVPYIIGELKKYKLVDAGREQMVASILQQVTGTPYGELKDVVIDVERARGGSFKIGKTTFEELFAALLQASMAQPKPGVDPAPPAPPVEKKPEAPVTENTRG